MDLGLLFAAAQVENNLDLRNSSKEDFLSFMAISQTKIIDLLWNLAKIPLPLRRTNFIPNSQRGIRDHFRP